MSTYVFVRGAWHGSWCWKRVRGALQALQCANSIWNVICHAANNSAAVGMAAKHQAESSFHRMRLTTSAICVSRSAPRYQSKSE